MSILPLLKPSCTTAEVAAVNRVLHSGWWGQGPEVEAFEREMADFYGVASCVTVNSATAALHLACMALGVGPGDEVIVPALTFVSTGLAPLYCGAQVVLADVCRDTLCIDWEDVSRKLTPRTKAIIPVDYAGYPAPPPANLGVPIIQDGAHSCGGTFYGDLLCLSFHPVKNLATGDGGAILAGTNEHDARLRALRWCGIDRSTWDRTKNRYGWDYTIEDVGYKCHWNDIQAAIGRVQLQRLIELNSKRRQQAQLYTRLLAGACEIPQDCPEHTWHLYVIRVPAEKRNRVIDALLNANISAGVHYKPLNHYPMFDGATPVTEQEWQRLITLPLFYDLDVSDQRRAAHIIREVLREG